jgi:hypothetical protein
MDDGHGWLPTADSHACEHFVILSPVWISEIMQNINERNFLHDSVGYDFDRP